MFQGRHHVVPPLCCHGIYAVVSMNSRRSVCLRRENCRPEYQLRSCQGKTASIVLSSSSVAASLSFGMCHCLNINQHRKRRAPKTHNRAPSSAKATHIARDARKDMTSSIWCRSGILTCDANTVYMPGYFALHLSRIVYCR